MHIDLDTPDVTRAPNRATRRAATFGPRAARSTTLAARITLRQSSDAATAARTERARRVRARRQAVRDARRASR